MSKAQQLIDLIESSFSINDLKDQKLLSKLRELYSGNLNDFLGHTFYQRFIFDHKYQTRILVLYSNFGRPNTGNPHHLIGDGKGDEIVSALSKLEAADSNKITLEFNPKPITKSNWSELVKFLAEAKAAIHIDQNGTVLGKI